MKTTVLFSALFAMALFASCKKDEVIPPPPPENHNPTVPVINAGPADNSTNNASPVTFGWDASTDSDGDDVVYDIYLGTDQSALPVLSADQTGTSYTSTQLELEVLYYFKIVAKDGLGGTAESEIREFTTSAFGSFTDDRDGRIYQILKIGTQTWMAENLKYDLAGESWAYNNNEANAEEYGRLYTWDGLADAIPSGWHLATDTEWKTLESYLGMSASDLNLSGYSVTRGTNQGTQLQIGGSSLMNFPLAGFRSGASFSAIDDRTYLWVNTTVGGGDAYRRRLVGGEPYVYRFTNPNAGFAISVRLIKD